MAKETEKPESGDLQSQIEKGIAEGNVRLTSEDVGEFLREEKDKPEEVEGTVKAKVPEEADGDQLMNAAAKGSISDALKDDDSSEEIEIEPEDREAFLDALVSGERYSQPFSLFNGRVTGRFRCRTAEESMAIARQIAREVQDDKWKNALEYATRVRDMLLTAQVAELQGNTYPELKKPLSAVVEGENVTPPAWLEQVSAWKQQEAVIVAVYDELRKFERKYWTMVSHGGNQNFWSPAGSTSG